MSVKFKDNSAELKHKFEKAKEQICKATGITLEKYAKENITAAGAVDTGRMRNSIAHASSGEQTATINYDSRTGEESRSTPSTNEKDKVYLGTNVDYAIYQEMGSRSNCAVHFLRDAINDHADELKQLAEAALKAASD